MTRPGFFDSHGSSHLCLQGVFLVHELLVAPITSASHFYQSISQSLCACHPLYLDYITTLLALDSYFSFLFLITLLYREDLSMPGYNCFTDNSDQV